ncbi:branched-chain amino acid ABC transporter permease [Ottowia sp.]|jgi:branched-chain amino acid transport system permease protein|uniref:branched-chain amino acid ABC transporter permease n=1 Tax=Ottowia sp. TaxID=1898956 RepID=UPI0025DB098C|nr:branched-chain amino acid ABC transporter permease [Ottowia sp.]MBK6614626.1 branched-chain amino acid ABC transporter permease [Ottowia sp.]MBK6745714.1 branched-chain amino acid ABC transporter permease [Ottowia sp.]
MATGSNAPTHAPAPASAGAARTHLAAFVAMAAIFVLAPLLGVYPVFMMKVMCFALFACAFNLLLGFGGLLSFGHAMFLGGAGYVAAHAAKVWGLTPELAVGLATLCAAALGWVTGLLAIRRQGIYFAMITLALAQMVFFLSLQAPFTGGEDGIQAVPRGRLLGMIDLSNPVAMYGFVLAVFLGGFGLIYRIVHSPFGQVLQAIRENEPRAISLGYDADKFKHRAFVLSAALAGMAGATKAIVFQLASLTDVHWSMSGEVVLMTLVGGLGTLFGPMVGAAVIVAMQNYLAELGAWVSVVQGVIFVVCVLLFRRGIVGEIGHLLKKSL